MNDAMIQKIITRQEGYGPFVVMGLRAALAPQQASGAIEVLYFIEQALDTHMPTDEVVAKSVLKKMLKGIRVDLGETA